MRAGVLPAAADRGPVRTIAVVAAYSSSHEIVRSLVGVMTAADEARHLVVPYDQVSGAVAPARRPPTRPIDAAIFLGVPVGDEMASWIEEHQVCAVVVDLPDPRFHNIVIDHAGAAAEAGRYLRERGHERIAYLGHRQQHDYDGQSRRKLQGLTRALSTAPDVHLTELSVDAGRRTTMSMLASASPPTAIFAHNDDLAAGALAAARELGLDVPGDVALIGFNDTEVAEALDLTTFSQPYEQSGAEAIELLKQVCAALGGTTDPHRQEVTLTPKMVLRSTA